MKLVMADGSLMKAGGRVVKNVAGYDLSKLFTGSYGTLGLINELTFKLRPRPAKEVTILAAGPRTAVLLAAESIRQATLFPVATELLSAEMARRLNLETSPENVLLLVRFAGIKKSVQYQVEAATTLLRNAAGITGIGTEFEDQSLWRGLSGVPMGADRKLCWRASMKPAELGKFLKIFADTYRDSISSLLWHAGLGNGRVRVIDETSPEMPERIQAVRQLRAVAESLGGSLTIENAPIGFKYEVDSWGDFGSTRTLMKRVKEQLDPYGLFSPGRFKL
jgi:FAD/FMN-containing dehydrogenase